MKILRFISYCTLAALLLVSELNFAQTTVTIGSGTSSSSTRGPLQRSDTNSSTVFSRFVHIYTASELMAAGITSGASITSLNWELASSNVIIGSGNANMKVYIKNSAATSATADSWTNIITGSSLVVDNDYNTTNNFPGSNGWMPFNFSTPFSYTGGALEIAVDWDCSQVTTPSFSGDGALKWRWESTAPDNLVVKKTSSSSSSSTISDLKNERANIQIVYNTVSCPKPTGLSAAVTSTSANFSWSASTGSNSYSWKVVASGAGSAGTAIGSGTTVNLFDSISGLSEITSYDLFVESDCGSNGTSGFSGPYTFVTLPSSNATLTATIGTGTSSSSSRGPIQRSDTNSTTVFSRFVHVYTASELNAAGITSGAFISALNFELASSNVIIGSGNANLKVYIKNSNASAATVDSWTNITTGSSLVVDNDYNTTNNFPGSNGWMPFSFSSPFSYTGGSIEIAVDWDCSQVTTPSFSGDGSIKWRWESTAPNNSVVKKTSSSSPSTTISDLKNERANIQLVYSMPSCDSPVGLFSRFVTDNSAILYWDALQGNTYIVKWRVVGNATWSNSRVKHISLGRMSINGLSPNTSYEFAVKSNCGSGWSKLSSSQTFTTLGSGGCDIATGLTETSINATTAILDWNDVVNANIYKVRYRVVGSTVWQVKNLNKSNYRATGLTPSSNIEWQVRVYCGSSFTKWSTIKTFVTPALSPAQSNRISNLTPQLAVSPNPNSGLFNIEIDNENNTNYNIEVSTMFGKVVYQKEVISDGNAFETTVNLENQEKGIYIVRAYNYEFSKVTQIIIR